MWMSIKDASEALGRGERDLRQMAAAGELPARREGRRWLVDVEAIPDEGALEEAKLRVLLDGITCPRQLAVAARAPEVLDVFSTAFARMRRTERLSAFEQAESDAARWRNAVRMAALGMVVRLGRDLGLATNDLHGDARLRGRTQVPELRGVQRTTALNALRMCDAMLEDKGDMPATAAARYKVIRDRARDDVARARPRNTCTCPGCSDERKEAGGAKPAEKNR